MFIPSRRRGVGQSGEVAVENAASCAIGPPGAVVSVNSGSGIVQAQLDAQGCVAQMWQAGGASAAGSSSFSDFLTQNKTLVMVLGVGLFGLVMLGGRRR